MVRRRLKRDETLQEYYYAMKEIAARGKIEAARKLSIGDLISCCNILGLEYGNREEIMTRILHDLMDLDTLTLKDSEQDDELNEDASDEETVDEQDDEREEERSNKESENNLEENYFTRGGGK